MILHSYICYLLAYKILTRFKFNFPIMLYIFSVNLLPWELLKNFFFYNNDLHKKLKKKHTTGLQQYFVLMGENKMLKI